MIIHQELALIPELSIAENIFLGNETAIRGVINWDEANHRAIELLARVGLRENPLTPVKHLGIGKQQLVEIAKALARRSSCSSSTSPPPPSTTTTPSTCSTCSRACRARASPRS